MQNRASLFLILLTLPSARPESCNSSPSPAQCNLKDGDDDTSELLQVGNLRLHRQACGNGEWDQCGGKDFNGETCCMAGNVCKSVNEWYSQCQSDPTFNPTNVNCNQPWAQCGGDGWMGVTCCTSGWSCQRQNKWYSQCLQHASPSDDGDDDDDEPTPNPAPKPTSKPTQTPTVMPTLVPSTPTHAPSGSWDGEGMHLTHYWDCSGQGCDASTLQPWDISKYVSPPGYGPQDPQDFGGPMYGEQMWLTGAASDKLSELMGENDPCCGSDPNSGVGGCGKCLLVQNPDSLHPDWTAVVMKKNRCPPWSTGCSQPHFDIAAPGFDNLQFSTANICGLKPKTGFDSQKQSEAVGSWWNACTNTAECSNLCDQLPEGFQKGCKLFASWGWTRGDPKNVKYKAVQCPAAFTAHIASQFGPKGVSSSFDF